MAKHSFLPRLFRQDLEPFKEISRDLENVERSFNDFWRGAFLSPLMQERSKAPKIDVLEDDKEIQIVADLPGVEEKEISIEVNNGLFSLHGEKKEEREEKHNNYRISERSSGYFYRSFQLPADVDESKVEATLKDGVLKVVLPKSAEARKHKKIEIKRL